MGRSQVLYNKTKAKMRRGRDGSSILSELTDGSGTPSAPPPSRHHQPQFMASYTSEQSAWNEMSAAAEYSESEPSVSITESIQQQQQLRQQQQVEEADETVNRLLLEMPSATSAYAQSYAGRSSSLAAAAASSHYNTTSSTGRRGGRHYYPHDLLRLDDAASLPSLLDYNMPLLLNKNDDASNVLQVDIIDACLQQQMTLAERLNIPQHLLDAALPQAEHETDSACDDVVSIKSMFHDRLHQANDRIMAARSPSPSPTRMTNHPNKGAHLQTMASPRNAVSTPRSLLPAPSDENSILAEEAVQELMLDASSSSDDDGKGDDFILASRQSSDDDDDDDETMQLLGSITTKQPSLSTNGSSTLAGEGILDQPMMRRSLLAPLHPPSQPMHSAMNEQQQQPVPTMADIAVPKSTTAIEGVLKIHRKSLSPPRDARVNKVAQQSPQVAAAAAAAAAAASSMKNVPQQQHPPLSAGRAPSPASIRMRTPILVPAAERHHLPFPPNKNDNVAQFTGEDMTAISSVGLQSLRDDARHPPPPSPPLPENNGWAPKPGESFEIKTVPGRARASSPRSSPKMLTASKSPSVISPSAHSKALPNTTAKTEKSASPISSPKPKVVSEAAHYVSSRSLSPKQQSLLHRIRSASPNAQAATASAATASAAPPANKKPPPQLKVNTNFDSHDKRSSKSPSRAGTASRAQLYPIHDVSVTAQKQDSTPEANKLPSNDDAQALLYSAGPKSQRRGRSPVRRGDSSRQKPAAKPTPSAMAASGADDSVDNTSAQTSAMLSSIQLLEDCDTVPGIEVTERKAKSILKSSSGRGGAGSFSYQGDDGRDLGQSKSRASDIATYVEDESNQGLEIKRKPSDNKRSSNKTNSSSPLRIKIATKEVPTFSRNSDKTGNRSSPPQRQMVDVIDLSAVDSASLSPSRIIKAIRTGQPFLRDKTSSLSPTKHRDKSPTTTRRNDQNCRSVSSERKQRHSKSSWRNNPENHDDEEGIEVGDVGELNDWLDSVIA